MKKRVNKVSPEQGQLPLEFTSSERYDPRDGDEPVSKNQPKPFSILKQTGQPSPSETIEIIRDSHSQKWNLNEEKKDEKPASPNSTNNLNPFIDQFCEQVARIITKGKKVQGVYHESSGLHKGK